MSASLVKVVFIAVSCILAILIILHKAFVSKIKDNIKISHFVASIAFFLALYVIFGIALIFVLKSIFYKFIIFIFAMSPFIIGKLATYKKEKLYSFIQVVSVILSTLVVIIKC